MLVSESVAQPGISHSMSAESLTLRLSNDPKCYMLLKNFNIVRGDYLKGDSWDR